MRRRADPSTLNFDHARALRLAADAGLRFPLVAKPDIGRHGHGVRLVEDAAALRRYLEKFPGGAKLILQRYVPWAGEAVVHYARMPGEGGRILSLTLRSFPHVIGDGAATVRELVARDRRLRRHAALFLGHDPSHLGHDRAALDRVPEGGENVRLSLIGSRRAGARQRDASELVTPALAARIGGIVDGMPEVHYARLNLRFGSREALSRGEDVVVIDIGGIAGDRGGCLGSVALAARGLAPPVRAPAPVVRDRQAQSRARLRAARGRRILRPPRAGDRSPAPLSRLVVAVSLPSPQGQGRLRSLRERKAGWGAAAWTRPRQVATTASHVPA